MKIKHYIQPSYLQQGDTIGITAPARKISKQDIQAAIEQFTSWGLNVRLGKNIFSSHQQFSGTDGVRASNIQEFWNDPQVKAIIFARGGYGSVRLIDQLDFSNEKYTPKWMVGYSDITIFHSLFHTTMQMQTIHGTMPVNFPSLGTPDKGITSLKKALFGELQEYRVNPHPFNRKGKASGILTGGNLSVLYSLSGTPYDINTRGKILFIEDIDEYLYHIDRMMMNFKLSGKLEGLKGLIVGGMTDMRDNTVPYGKNAYEIIYEHVKDYDFPVCYGFSAGHVMPNHSLYFGRKVHMEIEKNEVIIRF